MQREKSERPIWDIVSSHENERPDPKCPGAKRPGPKCQEAKRPGIVVNSSRSRTKLSHFSRRIWKIHAEYTCFLRLQLLVKIGYIPQYKWKNPGGLYEISFPLTRMNVQVQKVRGRNDLVQNVRRLNVQVQNFWRRNYLSKTKSGGETSWSETSESRKPGAKTLPEPSLHVCETSSMTVTFPEASLWLWCSFIIII